MAFFKYTAKNNTGATVKGQVEAGDLNQASVVLMERGMLIIHLKPLIEDSLLFSIKSKFGGVGQDDIVNMTRQLATMITAGLPLANALSILVSQSKPELSKIMATVLQDVEGGSTFAKALGKYPKYFSRLYIHLVEAGETGGVLDQVLERLAVNLEKDKEFRAKTKGALIYPAIVMVAMAVVAVVMMVFVIPNLTAMYTDFGAELPMSTKILMGMSNFMVKTWYLLLLIGGATGIFFKRWIKTEVGQRAYDGFMLKIPIISSLQQKIMLTEFTRTMSLLLGAGISLLRGLDIVAQSSNNIIYREALVDVTKKVEKGIMMSQALSTYDVFPPILHQMAHVGEQTGKLDDVLGKLSSYFESESEHAVKNLTAAIEPAIMVVLGLGVGAMVIAIIMPIYGLTSQF
ncbi:MAG: type II secretion system F family protein [Patescibacteria group bacterium]|nr:type II secretion system F family protein [Patescibacteria group bacterium]